MAEAHDAAAAAPAWARPPEHAAQGTGAAPATAAPQPHGPGAVSTSSPAASGSGTGSNGAGWGGSAEAGSGHTGGAAGHGASAGGSATAPAPAGPARGPAAWPSAPLARGAGEGRAPPPPLPALPPPLPTLQPRVACPDHARAVSRFVGGLARLVRGWRAAGAADGAGGSAEGGAAEVGWAGAGAGASDAHATAASGAHASAGPAAGGTGLGALRADVRALCEGCHPSLAASLTPRMAAQVRRLAAPVTHARHMPACACTHCTPSDALCPHAARARAPRSCCLACWS